MAEISFQMAASWSWFSMKAAQSQMGNGHSVADVLLLT